MKNIQPNKLNLDEKVDLLIELVTQQSEDISSVKNQQTAQTEQLTRMENKLDRLSLRTHEDDVATMKDVEKVTDRLKILEKSPSKA